MSKRVICNPPVGVYDNEETHVGHGFYLTLMDVTSRYQSEFEDVETRFPSRAYNLFGKKGDKLMEDENNIYSEEDLRDYGIETIENDGARQKLNLSSYEILVDDEKEIREGVKKDFKELYEKGFLKKDGSSYFLDCGKISEQYDVNQMLEKIDFNPERSGKEFRRFVNDNKKMVEITRPRNYAVENPLEGDKIGPLFTLANLWDSRYDDADSYTLACSTNVLCKYGALRFFSRIGVDSEPGMDEIVVWPRIVPEGGMEEWDIEEIVEDRYHGDMLRYSFMRNYSNSGKTKLNLTEDMFREGRNFVYRVANLRKPLSETENPEKTDWSRIYPGYRDKMRNKKFQEVLENLYHEVKDISQKVNSDNNLEDLAGRYLGVLDMVEPFAPAVTDLGRSEVDVQS